MSRAKGEYFENKACDYLISQGYNIKQRNFYARKLGEIDIIALKDDVYHFVEVKSGDSFEAIYNITQNKLRKLFKSVEYYLKIKNLDTAFCVDAIIFAGEDIEFLENITM
jgi:putative endonuclease